MTWNNDMSAAPRDGTNILAYRKDVGEAFIVRWAWMEELVPKDRNGDPIQDYDEEYANWWSDAWGWQANDEEPTHWMHLPTPPQEPDIAE